MVRAIESVLAQTLVAFEVIVVDDGSMDGSVETVKRLVDPRITLLQFRHQGVSSARNAGARSASGQYLAFLDSDDEVLPTWLAQLDEARRRDDADLVLCGVTSIGRDGSTSDRLPDPVRTTADDIAPRFLAGSFLVRRDLFLDHGGYDPDISFGENSELAMRLLTAEPQPLTVVLPLPLLRVTERAAPANQAARIRGAEIVLAKHRAIRKRIPETWSAYHTLVALDNARRGHRHAAARHLVQAFVAKPSWGGLGRLVTIATPPLARRVWTPAKDAPAVIFVVLAPGVGGSVRSLASVLRRLDGVWRVAARPSPTSTSRLIMQGHLADDVIDLALPSGHRVRDRSRGAASLTRYSWRIRHNLAAIHANGLAELNLAVVPAILTGCRLVVWVHEWEVPPLTRRLGFVFRNLPSIRFASVSQPNLAMLLESGVARPSQVSIVVNPIDPMDVEAVERVTHPLVRVGYLGTPARYKGFHLLPDLVRLTRDSPVEWTVYAGPRSLMPETFAQLEALGVHLPGKTLDVRKAYASCDIVIVPSLKESFGRVAAEAMVNRIPVVASCLPSLELLLGENEAGVLFPPGDSAAGAHAIARLAADPELRIRLGNEGRRRVTRFAPGPASSLLIELYGIVPSN